MKNAIVIIAFTALLSMMAVSVYSQQSGIEQSLQSSISIQENIIAAYQDNLERLVDLKCEHKDPELLKLIDDRIKFSTLKLQLAKMKITFFRQEIAYTRGKRERPKVFSLEPCFGIENLDQKND